MTTRCVICGEPFEGRNARSVLCGRPECVAERKRDYVRGHRAKHPERPRESARRYYEAHRELIKGRRQSARNRGSHGDE